MIKTITLTPGEVNSVEFTRRYPYFYIKNFSTSDVYASTKKFIFVADEDEVTKIPAGTTGIVYGTLASEYVNILCENAAKIEVIGAFEGNINFNRKIALGGDSGTSGAVDAYSKAEINDMLSEKADNSDLKTVAKTGSYNDLSDKPEIPVVDVDKSYVDNALKEKADNSDVEEVSNTVNTHISDKSVHMTADEKEKLAGLENYDDTEIKANIAKKVDKKDGYSLVSDTEITRLAEVDNYDDTQIKNDIALNLSSIGMSRKNFYEVAVTSDTVYDTVAYTLSDGKIILLGTPSWNGGITLCDKEIAVNKDMYISGWEALDNVSYIIQLHNPITGDTAYEPIPSTGRKITAGLIIKKIYIERKSTHSGAINATIIPMLCYADIIDKNYEPYTPSLQEQINDIVARLTAGGL